jgi:hypothetical protein
VHDLVDATITNLARVTAWAPFNPAVAMALMRAERDELVARVIEAYGGEPVLDNAVRRVVAEAIEHAAATKH